LSDFYAGLSISETECPFTGEMDYWGLKAHFHSSTVGDGFSLVDLASPRILRRGPGVSAGEDGVVDSLRDPQLQRQIQRARIGKANFNQTPGQGMVERKKRPVIDPSFLVSSRDG
jgi:hypothetical protein